MPSVFSNSTRIVTYFLGVVVISIWGLIMIKIFYGTGDKDHPVVHAKIKKQIYVKLVDHQDDSVLLDFDYRDPFFDKEIIVIKNSKGDGSIINPDEVAKIPSINWGEVNFRGYVNNKATGQKLAIIAVKGNEILLAVGQQENGIKLLGIFGDSIKVSYQKTAKFIRLK